MGKMSSFCTGFIFGGLAAGSAVLLSTPKSGEALRRQAKDGAQRARSTFDQIRTDSLTLKNDLLTATRKSIPAIKEGTKEIKQSIVDWRKDTEYDIDHLQSRIRELNAQMDRLEETTKKRPPSN